ncbi:MAG: hypothetical protein Q9163_002949 [Psora crenata]
MDPRQYIGQTSNIHADPTAPSSSSIPPLQTFPNKKRRTTTTGSRGVANLTPEQLARKRASDREAQRAIRERTKVQIENLERQIEGLRAQRPYQELQHSIRQKETVQAENAELKRTLVSIQALIQPLLSANCAIGEAPQHSLSTSYAERLYIMFLIMRWQIAPTQENYERLPDWVTPRASQLFQPHPAWIDHLPWPRMRDKLVQIYPSIPFDNFFIPYTTTVSVNWPYDSRDILFAASGTDELSMDPNFETHLRDLGNWSLGPAFAQSHPILADTTTIRRNIDFGTTP